MEYMILRKKMPENEELLRIYAENEAEIAPIWERMVKQDPSATMLDAVRYWLGHRGKPTREECIEILTKQRDALTFALNELNAANFAKPAGE